MGVLYAEGNKTVNTEQRRWRVPVGTSSLATGGDILREVMSVVTNFEKAISLVNTGKGGKAEKLYREFQAHKTSQGKVVVKYVKDELKKLVQQEQVSYLERFYPNLNPFDTVIAPKCVNRIRLHVVNLEKLYGVDDTRLFWEQRLGRNKKVNIKHASRLENELEAERVHNEESDIGFSNSHKDSNRTGLIVRKHSVRDADSYNKIREKIRTSILVQREPSELINQGLLDTNIRSGQLKQLRQDQKDEWYAGFYGKSKKTMNTKTLKTNKPRQDYEFVSLRISYSDQCRLINTVEYFGMTVPEFVWEIADEYATSPAQQAQVQKCRAQYLEWYIAIRKIYGPKKLLAPELNPFIQKRIDNKISNKEFDSEVYRIYERQIRNIFRRRKKYVAERFERLTGMPW